MEVLHKLAIHEAYNSHKYGEVQLYEWDAIFTTPITFNWETRPVKKLTINIRAGYAISNFEDDDRMFLYINGETTSKKTIKISPKNDMPFTLEGLLITGLTIVPIIGYHAIFDTDADKFDIITYH